MIGLLNLGSLLLGLLAWILPVINLMRFRGNEHRRGVAFSVLSMSACAISLCFQMFYHYHLVIIEDWSALMDITGVMVTIASVLLIGTVGLNTMTLILYQNRVPE
ncbi:hypothetical protein FGG79_02485 [Bacillus sp. BHET2]|uniref:hypothetical protein n=1 Tax=Bacillus sp. BHET2 TaxID=2583818 RepID=UPI00110D8DC2|nr:hypothetical protein [Bacillus sp. BHET2]TMU87028.1 hypothetical protein FGG79_02485 [Bacillus sp. BHET2]